MPEYASKNLLLNLDEKFSTDPNIVTEDFLPTPLRHTYSNSHYLVPIDADFIFLYVRTDVLGRRPIPQTWDDLLDLAESLVGQDFNFDGEPDFPFCLPTISALPHYSSIIAQFVQTQGFSQGMYFDLDTFEPLVADEGFKLGLSYVLRLLRLANYSTTLEWSVLNLFSMRPSDP